MVEKITYSQLADIARITDKTIEEVAKERGISKKELADLAKLGGTPDAPVDIASYKKVNINEIKGVLSVYDAKVQDGKVKLSAEARKQLKEFGVEGLVMEDGVLYAQHKDGNKYMVSSTQDFTPDFAAVEDEKQREANKRMAEGIKNGFKEMIKLGLAFTPLGAMSCENDINANQNQGVYITIPANKQQDYTDIINKILQRLDSMDANVQAYKTILNDLKSAIESKFVSEKNYTDLFDKIIQWLQTISENQVNMQIDNNKNAADILVELKKIVDGKEPIETKLDEIMKLLQQIKSVGESIDGTTKEILAAIKAAKEEIIQTLNTNNQAVLDAIAKLDENDQKTLNILNDIKGLIAKYGDKGKELGESILVAIGKIQTGGGVVDLTGIMEMLDKLVNGQKETNKNITNLTCLFNKFSAKTAEQLNTIIAKMDKTSPDYNDKFDAIIKLLEKMDANADARNQKVLALITKYGDKGIELGDAILQAISKIKVTGGGVVDLSGIEALLEKLVNGQKETNQNIANLTCLFNKFSAKTAEQLNTIISKMDKTSPDYNDKFDAIIKLLKQMDANNDIRNQNVLAAINKLGDSVTADLAAILAAINALPASQQESYKEILNAILNKIKEGNEANDANFKAVLAKIHDLGVNVTYGMNAILDAIKGMPDYTAKLNAIIARLDALGAKAQEILEAIKDHDVNITVDVTGKVKCECNCNCGNGSTHEGILGDLNDLLG